MTKKLNAFIFLYVFDDKDKIHDTKSLEPSGGIFLNYIKYNFCVYIIIYLEILTNNMFLPSFL